MATDRATSLAAFADQVEHLAASAREAGEADGLRWAATVARRSAGWDGFRDEIKSAADMLYLLELGAPWQGRGYVSSRLSGLRHVLRLVDARTAAPGGGAPP